jgi:broad specificity phosphatase PhoE
MGNFNVNFLPPGGESLSQVERRASKWLDDEIIYNEDMFDKCKFYSDKGEKAKIAVYSHGMTIKTLLHYIVGFDKSFIWKISIDNTSITHLSFGEKGWALHSINDTSHLK